jgi:hypothetical protein
VRSLAAELVRDRQEGSGVRQRRTRTAAAVSETPNPLTPASFRVYTAAELRAMPLRASYRPGTDPATSSKIAGVPMAAAWTAGGILLAGFALCLTLVAGRASEEHTDSAPPIELGVEAPVSAPEAPTAVAIDPPPNDLELPDDSSPAKPAKRAKNVSGAHPRASR